MCERVEASNRLRLLQNQAAKILTGVRRFCHVLPLYAQLQWLRFHDFVIFQSAVLLFKAVHGLTSDCISSIFACVSGWSGGGGLFLLPAQNLSENKESQDVHCVNFWYSG